MPAHLVADGRRRLAVGACVVSIALSAVMPAPANAAPCWVPPVVAVVADPFREPPCPWCAGNRGIEYRLDGAVAVRAAASGSVVFSGRVAGIRYVVIQLANGWRHTYGHLTSTSIDVGEVVLAGHEIAGADEVFFFGLRIGDEYRDPAPFLGVERRRPRLVPVDGTPPRPAPAPRLQCPHAGSAR